MSSVIGSGAHNVPLKYIGGSSEEFASSNQYVGVRPILSSVAEETPADKVQSSLLEYSLGNRSITLANGNRELVNDGSKLGTFPVATGQGLAFDGTQQIYTGTIIDLAKDFTLFASIIYEAPDGYHGSYSGVGGRAYFGFQGNKLRIALGSSSQTFSTVNQIGDRVDLFIRFKTSTNIVECGYIDKREIMSTDILGSISLDPFMFGNITVTGLFPMLGICSGVYLLPSHYATDQELEMHRRRPELTLYKKADGILRSAFLTQATLDLMEAGEGFHYPLSEGTGTVVHNHALRTLEPKTIVNAANSAIWDNAKDLSYGVQQVLVQPDSLGLNTILADNDVLEFDGKSVVTVNMTLEKGDWFFDFYAKANPTGHGNTFPVFMRLDAIDAVGVVVGSIELWYSVNNVRISFGGSDVSANTDTTEGIYSIEWENNILTIYEGTTLLGTSVALPTYDHFIITYLGRGANAVATINGSLYLQSGKVKRTDVERATTVNKLKSKFGVV